MTVLSTELLLLKKFFGFLLFNQKFFSIMLPKDRRFVQDLLQSVNNLVLKVLNFWLVREILIKLPLTILMEPDSRLSTMKVSCHLVVCKDPVPNWALVNEDSIKSKQEDAELNKPETWKFCIIIRKVSNQLRTPETCLWSLRLHLWSIQVKIQDNQRS